VDTADRSDPGNPMNKVRTRESPGQLHHLLMEWDPIGVAGVPEAADEYDCMISPLMHQVYDGVKEKVTLDCGRSRRALRHARTLAGRLSFATDVVKWWALRSKEP